MQGKGRKAGMNNENEKEKESCKRVYLRLINYLLYHMRSLESYEKIFHFVQDVAMGEIRDRGG